MTCFSVPAATSWSRRSRSPSSAARSDRSSVSKNVLISKCSTGPAAPTSRRRVRTGSNDSTVIFTSISTDIRPRRLADDEIHQLLRHVQPLTDGLAFDPRPHALGRLGESEDVGLGRIGGDDDLVAHLAV